MRKSVYPELESFKILTTLQKNGVQRPNSQLDEHWVLFDFDVGALVATPQTLFKVDPAGNLIGVLLITSTNTSITQSFAPTTPPPAATSTTLGDGAWAFSPFEAWVFSPRPILIPPGWGVQGTIAFFCTRVKVGSLLEARDWL